MTNPYEPPTTTDDKKRRIVASRGAAFAAWVPFLVMITFFVPKFERMSQALRGRGELPAATDWVLWFASMNWKLFCAPSLIIAGLLLLYAHFRALS